MSNLQKNQDCKLEHLKNKYKNNYTDYLDRYADCSVKINVIDCIRQYEEVSTDGVGRCTLRADEVNR